MITRNTNKIVLLLAIMLTPWIVLVSSSVQLYSLNIQNLDGDLRTLFPFFCLTVIVATAGIGIIYDSQKNQHYTTVPWLYFLAGPLFVLANTLSQVTSSLVNGTLAFIVVICLWFGGSYLLRRQLFSVAVPFLAIFFVLVSIFDVIQITQTFSGDTNSEDQGGLKTDVFAKEDSFEYKNLPNIYHVVLDGYQADLFEHLINEEIIESLGGFKYFINNKTAYGITRLSIPSVFLGRELDSNYSEDKVNKEAFNSESSLIGILQDKGYHTSAYLHLELNFAPNLFHQVYFHQDFKQNHRWSNLAFIKLWTFTYMPELISSYFFAQETLNKISSGRLAPDGYPIVSLDAFNGFIANEPHQPEAGRYVFLHLIIPHSPYMLDENCEVSSLGSVVKQYRCANQLMMGLVKSLQELDRFDDSLIIFHADHGSNYEITRWGLKKTSVNTIDLEYHHPRSKALLLMKPIGVNTETPFTFDYRKSTLLDIAPTILSGINASVPKKLSGNSLLTTGINPAKQFYFINDGRFLNKYEITPESLEFVEKTPLSFD